MSTHSTVCTCGDPNDHIIMTRKTADGITAHLWSDGGITAEMGYRLAKGVPVRRRLGGEKLDRALKAGRLMLGDIGWYDRDEAPKLYAAAEKAAVRGGDERDMRAILREQPLPALSWQTTRADRDGKPTERQARLPRLRWPRLAVIDYCGGSGSKDGRYVLVRLVPGRDGDCDTTGFAFRNLRALWAHLETETRADEE